MVKLTKSSRDDEHHRQVEVELVIHHSSDSVFAPSNAPIDGIIATSAEQKAEPEHSDRRQLLLHWSADLVIVSQEEKRSRSSTVP